VRCRRTHRSQCRSIARVTDAVADVDGRASQLKLLLTFATDFQHRDIETSSRFGPFASGMSGDEGLDYRQKLLLFFDKLLSCGWVCGHKLPVLNSKRT